MVNDNVDIEEEMRSIAWEVVGNLSIASLLADCVDALVEVYKMDDGVYQQDRETLMADGNSDEYSVPFMNYITTKQGQEEENVSTITE